MWATVQGGAPWPLGCCPGATMDLGKRRCSRARRTRLWLCNLTRVAGQELPLPHGPPHAVSDMRREQAAVWLVLLHGVIGGMTKPVGQKPVRHCLCCDGVSQQPLGRVAFGLPFYALDGNFLRPM